MNLVNCYVVEILGEPYEKYGRWWVSVRFDSYGVFSTTNLMFDSREEALAVKIGYEFLS